MICIQKHNFQTLKLVKFGLLILDKKTHQIIFSILYSFPYRAENRNFQDIVCFQRQLIFSVLSCRLSDYEVSKIQPYLHRGLKEQCFRRGMFTDLDLATWYKMSVSAFVTSTGLAAQNSHCQDFSVKIFALLSSDSCSVIERHLN